MMDYTIINENGKQKPSVEVVVVGNILFIGLHRRATLHAWRVTCPIQRAAAELCSLGLLLCCYLLVPLWHRAAKAAVFPFHTYFYCL